MRKSPTSFSEKRSASSKSDDDGYQPRYFMVFSTSCSEFQNWQALAFFYFAKKAKQPGNVTRLTSGCNPKQASDLRRLHKERVEPLSDRFHLHITPDFGVGTGNQKYWNKPKGLLDWMQNALGFPERAAEYNNDIIIMVDPDMMVLRPITHDLTNYEAEWLTFKSHQVHRGLPIAQVYGFGSSWLSSLKGRLVEVVGPDSPALNVSLEDASTFYPAGPPYLATGFDMYALATHWVEFLPKVHQIFPEFMAEMHAYCVAAAHLKLPHQLAEGFMVSDVGAAHREAFGFLKRVSRKEACRANIPADNLPLVMHFCQRYAAGRWFFSKYKLIENFFECDAPLMREPPLNVGEIYDWYIFPNGVETKDYSKPKDQHFIVEHVWMLCTVLFGLNEAATELKSMYCGPSANYSKTFHFHEETKFQAMLDDPHTNPFQTTDAEKKAKIIMGM